MNNRPSEYDKEDGRRRDEKAWSEWHAVNYPSGEMDGIGMELDSRMLLVRALEFIESVHEGEWTPGYSRAQLAHDINSFLYHANGDAPVAWAVFAPNGNIRLWSTDSAAVREFADANGVRLTPLYKR